MLRTPASRNKEKLLGVFEAKIEESEKARSHQQSNPEHLWLELWLELPVVFHLATTAGQPPALTILYIYCTGGTEVPQSHTLQPLSMCHQKLFVEQYI